MALSNNQICRARYAINKERGICVKCNQTARPGKANCEKCARKHAMHELNRSNKRKVNGACVRCGGIKLATHLTCEPCRIIVNIIQKRSKEKSRVSGKCAQCPNASQSNHTLCVSCHDKKICSKYKIAIKDLHFYRIRADGKCESCGDILSDDPKLRALDHEHTSKIVRGILCSGCNKAEGSLRKKATTERTIERAKQLIIYLQRFEDMKNVK